MVNRKTFMQGALLGASSFLAAPTQAFAIGNPTGVSTTVSASPSSATTSATIAYRSLSLPLGDQFGGTNVPVACWYPAAKDLEPSQQPAATATTLTYPHRISLRKIGMMLAGWTFIPNFVARDFPLRPTVTTCVLGGDKDDYALPTKAPVVLLAHGYLGSRFDLSHLAEALAAEGFVCLAPEYPESLAASYDYQWQGLDRTIITQRLLEAIPNNWNIQPTSYGIVGHSLGCGTAVRTGDSTWTRVLMCGGLGGANVPGNTLILSSMNDGVISLAKRGGLANLPSDYTLLKEQTLLADNNKQGKLPNRAALVFDRPDAPNHISFLAEGVNDAMVSFLSPLLPVAIALSIPVLDFDRYQASRDSIPTAEVVRPLVTQYLKQHMKMT